MDVAEFLIRYPEFDKQDYERIAIALEDAELRISQTNWTVNVSKIAIAALTAHILYSRLAEMARTTGLATALTNGQQVAPTAIESNLKTTIPGSEYMELLNLYAIGTGFSL
jgi:hypothetical protein